MRSLLVPVSLLLLVGSCVCQFPRPCANSEGLRTKECCPVWEGDGSACGMKSGRGKCGDVRVSSAENSKQYPHQGKDDRERWPTEFFNRTCNCFGRYGGFDCGECMFGYYGKDCNEYQNHIRKNVMTLSADEKKKLVDYFDQAKTTINPDYVIATATREEMGPNGENPKFADASTVDVFAWIHYYVTHPTYLPDGKVWPTIDFAHQASAFPIWHRVELLFFENEIKKMTKDNSFTLPYWDWRGKTECDVCTDDLMGGSDPENPNLISPASPFSKWKGVCTKPDDYIKDRKLCDGAQEGPLLRFPKGNAEYQRMPTEAEVELMMAVQQYDTAPFSRSSELSFRNMLEGWISPQSGKKVNGEYYMHNLVHNFLNGTMSIIEATANDPLFFLHHCMIDSLMERWLRKHLPTYEDYPEANAPIGHNTGYHMVPFMPIYRNIEYLLSKNLGYEYDYLQDMAIVDHEIDAVWSDYSEWSDCTLPGLDIRCKRISGTQSRTRRCIKNGAAGICVGAATETRACYNIRDCCNLKGTWGDWSEWSKCFPACGSENAKKFREKLCTPDYSEYSEKIAFHGRPCADCGALPDGEVMVESLPCPLTECLQGRRFV